MKKKQNSFKIIDEQLTDNPAALDQNLCSYCEQEKATWFYAPGREIACDACVPRGCSCNEEPLDGNYDNMDPANWAEPTDEMGRKYPCCEWMRIDEMELRDNTFDRHLPA